MASISVSCCPEPPGPEPRITIWAEGGVGPAAIEEAVWRAALQLWPDWPGAAPAALRQAAERGAPQAPAGIHTLAQLSAALGRPELVLVSSALSDAAADLCSRAIEWAAETAGLPVRWVVEREAAALSGVTRLLDAGGALSARPADPKSAGGEAPTGRTSRQRSPELQGEATSDERSTDRDAAAPKRGAVTAPNSSSHEAGPKVLFSPIIGRPHPASPAEQVLAELLLADPQLAPLVAFNQPIELPDGHRAIVDLLLAGAGLVVEVDGYRFHSSRRAFQRDRHRDYLLTRQGWRVLRLTATEVADAPEAAIEKIRALLSAAKEPLCLKS